VGNFREIFDPKFGNFFPGGGQGRGGGGLC